LQVGKTDVTAEDLNGYETRTQCWQM